MTGFVLRPALAVILAVLAVTVLAAAPALAGEWPTIHGDAANTGYSAETFDPVFFNFGWENATTDLMHSSPVVYGVGIWAGSIDGWLYCLDWADGHAYWLYDTGAPVWSSATVHEDWVYLTSPIGLYKFKLFDPFTAFLFPLSTEITEYTPPKIAENRIFVVGADGYAYAVNASVGTTVWKTWIGNTSGYADESFASETLEFDFDSYDKTYIRSSCPAYYKNKLFTGSPDGGLWALDAATGEVLWRFQADGSIVGGVSADNNTVYFGTLNGSLYALNTYSGDLRWEVHLGSLIWATPAVGNDGVYIGSYDNNFYCLDAATGEEVWKVAVGCQVSSSAAVTDVFVTFGGEDGVLYVLNATSGAEILRFETGDKITSSPAISNGFIFFTSWDNKFYAIGREVSVINGETTTTTTTPAVTTTTTPAPSLLTAAFAVAVASSLCAVALHREKR